jgi:hypothetical protein
MCHDFANGNVKQTYTSCIFLSDVTLGLIAMSATYLKNTVISSFNHLSVPKGSNFGCFLFVVFSETALRLNQNFIDY